MSFRCTLRLASTTNTTDGQQSNSSSTCTMPQFPSTHLLALFLQLYLLPSLPFLLVAIALLCRRRRGEDEKASAGMEEQGGVHLTEVVEEKRPVMGLNGRSNSAPLPVSSSPDSVTHFVGLSHGPNNHDNPRHRKLMSLTIGHRHRLPRNWAKRKERLASKLHSRHSLQPIRRRHCNNRSSYSASDASLVDWERSRAVWGRPPAAVSTPMPASGITVSWVGCDNGR